jgi:arginyl-tRNA synthetase
MGHGRGGATGDALANLLSAAGFRVEREYYINDAGKQVKLLGLSVFARYQQLLGIEYPLPEDGYRGAYIEDIAKGIINDHDNRYLQTRFEDAAELFIDYSYKRILHGIKEDLKKFGITFDTWQSERELFRVGEVEKSIEDLKAKGFIYEKDGALWFKSTDFGDDKDRVVIKSDGSYTYLAPDIAYHQEKYKRGFQWLINLWGPDHHGYVSRLKASVAAFGHSPETLSVIIVQLATIFRDGKVVHMSTRKGQYITLREVIDEVSVDAARFFFAMRRTSSHLDFDLDVAKKQTAENPVFYVQYAHARICSILRNAEIKIDKDAPLSVLKEKEELALIKKILQFSSILNICLCTLDPYMLTVYLQELSETFHKFYDQHRVLGQDDALTRARLSLIEGTKIVIAAGLELLGVSRPEKM